ncbi:hypothetical protein R5R35_011625 [Gryllus longicercus]|uniref:Bromodomain associated domain-containing protein n=1 Tax=Gryllus longicercus TaxID=2509291 RepID=A0AAN9VPN7_9ORTH
MVDMFNKIVLKVIAAKLTRDVGWLKIRSRPLEVMSDALHRFMKDISIRVYRYAEFSGRTEPSVNDINLVLQDLNIEVSELEKYKHKTKSVTTIHISQYPVPSPDELSLPHVLNDLDDDDDDITELNGENGSMHDNSPEVVSANAHSLLQTDFDVNSGRREEQSAVSFSKDESDKQLDIEVGENENEKEELFENYISSVSKKKRKKRRKKDKPEYIVSCTSNITQSKLKTDEMNVFGREKNDVTSAMAPKDITPVSDKLHIHLDFPKIVIKRLKTENVKCGNLNARKLSGHSPCKETSVSLPRKTKRKPVAKKIRKTNKNVLSDNINHKPNEKLSAFLF